MVEQAWKNHKVVGWSGFILKEKLKAVKDRIKGWHKEQNGNLNSRIERKTGMVNEFDKKQEGVGLNEQEVVDRQEAWKELNRMVELRDQIRVQQAT